MKTRIALRRAGLACLFALATSGAPLAQQGAISYAPNIHGSVQEVYYGSAAARQVAGRFQDPRLIAGIEQQILGFFALTPGSKVSMLESVGSCLLREGFMTNNELDALLSMFGAFANNDFEGAEAASKALIGLALTTNGSIASPFSNAMTSGLTAEEAKELSDGGREIVKGAVKTAMTAAGAALGKTVAEEPGAAAGAVIGSTAAEITIGANDKISDWLWGLAGVGDGVIAMPNGEPCTPPYIRF